MKSDTKLKILAIIKQNDSVRVHDIISQLELNHTGIFRHLLDLQLSGDIYKIGTPPFVRYFLKTNIMEDSKSEVLQNIWRWAQSGDPHAVTGDQLCPTRDVFQARSARLLPVLQKELNEGLSFLLLAVVDEIGNNSYDHNLGNWIDIAGAVLAHDETNRIIILSDRGQGVRKTISKVRANLKNDEDALQVVFTEIISGRAPEQRGNGLKFVKKVIEENNLMLTYFSGSGICEIVNRKMEIKHHTNSIPGMLAVIKY
ncbi:MAG: hypothetical protein UX10_C0016G0016 [Candidatus Magasanikbacteria bacterium GW2011_GWA2_45_39]|uniref:Histidine kinase/HSP90-like ATPase domain-containing protein n=2 Tax=Candidatus Magasanikiibacteriota TaxID=1752731 RepID=A0A0G1MYF9_9BACT|nr:MAG: hypothetical protein UX10_C0016G0016 [Candidatus Magasanikbacteria bacterium GW2011_GWA2_45_39]KKU13421.1 MAG: hypothetical protein UX20_C0022G0006 [Candidatus Magasanikbacteria bacterium GW2011_GWC2_45_8]HBW74061.1 hypothetical protein [Candidatus Magasanikbacteria bacterium]